MGLDYKPYAAIGGLHEQLRKLPLRPRMKVKLGLLDIDQLFRFGLYERN